jgi:hypothetical protein
VLVVSGLAPGETVVKNAEKPLSVGQAVTTAK